MRHLLTIFCLSSLLFTSCEKDTLPAAGYVQWVENEDNGLRISKQMGDYKLTVQYKPLDYVVLMEEKTEKLAALLLKQRTAQLDQMQYFSLRLQSAIPGANVSDLALIDNDHASVINYFTFGMQENIYLVEGKDTLSCKLFQFERTYDLAPYVDFVLAFDQPADKQPSDKVFVFNDTKLGIGPVRFQVSNNTISAIPHLITY